MPRSLPRHVINRIAALHLVSGVLDAFAHPVATQLDESERGRAAILASRIAMSVERAKLLDPHDATDSRLVNTVLRRNDAMCKMLESDVDARVALAMVLTIVANEEEAIPRRPQDLERRYEWGKLHTLLGEFYAVMDEDLTSGVEIGKGCAVGERMMYA